jgi:hypothetical protein
MKTLAWKAWYVGGRSFCSEGTTWEELPDDGMLGLVVVFDEVAEPSLTRMHRFVSGTDLYWMVDILGEPTICQGQHEDKPETRYPGAVIKRGAWTSDEEMAKVNEQMAQYARNL